MIKNVYIAFKTHLDIGFTDYSETVTKKYINEFLPMAVKVARELENTDTPFVWTTGAWLIHEALKTDDGTLENAIRDGLVAWHAMPFTTHTELMSPYVLREQLKMSKALDERFGINTISAKLTDVPGHTMGLVPLLCEYGVKFLDIGVNPASAMAELPDAFRWKVGNDEICVFYHRDYGTVMENGENAFLIANTNDNLGPQNTDAIKELYAKMKEQFPEAKIKAASLNVFAEKIDPSVYPVFEGEIGDNWIHGIGTDPWKVAGYKALQREIEKRGVSAPEDLLLVPEHTWGQDVKVHYPRTDDYEPEVFEKNGLTEERKHIEKSWEEQRDYVRRAAKELGFDLEKELECTAPCTDGLEKTEKTPDFHVVWQLYDTADYERFKENYLFSYVRWAILDFMKVGLHDYEGFSIEAQVKNVWKDGDGFIYELRFDEENTEKYGLPHIYALENDGKREFRVIGKKANRLPQAIWLKFDCMEGPTEFNKLGMWVDVRSALGSPLISAFDTGVRTKDYEVVSYDAALAAPVGRRLVDYGKPGEYDLWFNLYNSQYNTNFPLWYDTDTKYRFEIKKR